MKRQSAIKLAYAAVCLALCLILPMALGHIGQVGKILCPMHLPVLLCGFVCGWPYGLLVGAVTPLLRSMLFSMPPLYPTAVAMAFELAAYGLLAGLFYKLLPKKPVYVYVSLILAMLGGRVVWGLVQMILMGLVAQPFTWQIFMAGAFGNALPGILVQLVLIPVIVLALRSAKLMDHES